MKLRQCIVSHTRSMVSPNRRLITACGRNVLHTTLMNLVVVNFSNLLKMLQCQKAIQQKIQISICRQRVSFKKYHPLSSFIIGCISWTDEKLHQAKHRRKMEITIVRETREKISFS